MPKISFIMPTRNRSEFISGSVESIINQTIDDWELIVIEDHSSEDEKEKTKKIINKFNDPRVRVYDLEDNFGQGIASGRNYGNQVANSEILAVMDSDDACYPERATETIKAFENEKCDLVYSNYDIIDFETGETCEKNPDFAPRKFDPDHFKNFNFVPHPTVAYRKTMAADFPYNTFFEVAEDYDLISRLFKFGYKFHFIDKALVKKRRHKGNIMKKGFKVDYGDIVKENRGWK